MSWDFETEPEFQQKLDWADAFVRENVEPLDLIWPHLAHTPPSGTIRKVIDPLKRAVREQGLWATHLGPELGGQGHGAVPRPSSCTPRSARQVLRDYEPVDDLWPSGRLPKRLAAAREKYAAYLEDGDE